MRHRPCSVHGPWNGRPFSASSRFVTRFPSGSLLLLYTDGVTEAMNPQGEELGLRRLSRLVEARAASGAGAEEVVSGLLTELTAWTGSPSFDDDVALVAIRRVNGRP